ncbi:hypothetical protein FJTKL_03292 [Diaporthe vaccinii]|uniref:Uncharacterized protein n=1 Tax=Diaporthe vaccinii TaxID=105482 RepID=A0ABR4DV89_9PEZI
MVFHATHYVNHIFELLDLGSERPRPCGTPEICHYPCQSSSWSFPSCPQLASIPFSFFLLALVYYLYSTPGYSLADDPGSTLSQSQLPIPRSNPVHG